MKNLSGSIRDAYRSCHKDRTLMHVEEVADTGVRLAQTHCLDPEKIRIAALLHDVSVIMSPQEMYETAKDRNMPIDPAEEKYHFLLHQRISRLIAGEQFDIRDEVILDAIECHTTLKKSAGPYDKALFVADKISWDQQGVPPYHETLEKLAGESLDEACLFYIRYQFEHQLLLMPHRWIIEAYEDLMEKLNR